MNAPRHRPQMRHPSALRDRRVFPERQARKARRHGEIDMTNLDKPVSRRTRSAYAVLYSKPRHIVVTLCPGDVIAFRELGRRGIWRLPIERAFRLAVQQRSTLEARP